MKYSKRVIRNAHTIRKNQTARTARPIGFATTNGRGAPVRNAKG